MTEFQFGPTKNTPHPNDKTCNWKMCFFQNRHLFIKHIYFQYVKLSSNMVDGNAAVLKQHSFFSKVWLWQLTCDQVLVLVDLKLDAAQALGGVRVDVLHVLNFLESFVHLTKKREMESRHWKNSARVLSSDIQKSPHEQQGKGNNTPALSDDFLKGVPRGNENLKRLGFWWNPR